MDHSTEEPPAREPDRRSDEEIIAGWDDGISGAVRGPGRYLHLEHIWGTVITVDVALGEAPMHPGQGQHDVAEAAVRECLAFFEEVARIFSTYKPMSEVTLYRNGLARPGRGSALFEAVRADCEQIRRSTLGAFDPWAVPGGYDPSGYVKGWATEKASGLLSAAGLTNHMINAGGDIACRGDSPEDEEGLGAGRGWDVGILNPATQDDVVEVVTLHDEAIATSGRYERGDHVIDPRTGRPVTTVDSVSVVGPDCGLADAYASAAFVDGTEAMRWFSALSEEWSLHLVIGQTAYTHGPAFA